MGDLKTWTHITTLGGPLTLADAFDEHIAATAIDDGN